MEQQGYVTKKTILKAAAAIGATILVCSVPGGPVLAAATWVGLTSWALVRTGSRHDDER